MDQAQNVSIDSLELTVVTPDGSPPVFTDLKVVSDGCDACGATLGWVGAVDDVGVASSV